MIRPPVLSVASPPHSHMGLSQRGINVNVAAALLPAAVAGVLVWGLPALRVLALAVGSVLIFEWLGTLLGGRHFGLLDLSAVAHGLMLGLMLPASTPWWLVIVAAAVLSVIGRHFFGGPGGYPFNPVALAYAVVLVSWPSRFEFSSVLASYDLPAFGYEPLRVVSAFGARGAGGFGWLDLLVGRQPGGVGSTAVLFLALGAAYLLVRGFISWRVPFGFLVGLCGSVALLRAMGATEAPPGFHLAAGAAVFAGFFLLTDTTTSPTGGWARFVYGLLAGVLGAAIRVFGTYADGIVFAVLLANLANPLIDRLRRAPVLPLPAGEAPLMDRPGGGDG